MILYRCDLLITSADNQRYLNLIIFMALASFSSFILFVIRTDVKFLDWVDFLNIDGSSSFDSYSKKHNLMNSSTSFLLNCYNLFMFSAKMAYTFYLLVVYMYYIQSFKVSLDRGVDFWTFVFVFFPTTITSILSMSWFYMTIAKSVYIFVLFNLFQSEKLKKLSNDLIMHQPNSKGLLFILEHFERLKDLIKKFKMSQKYFNYSNQSFLWPLFGTLVYYPYTFLVSNSLSVNFLIISYSLNICCVLLPTFIISSVFKYYVSYLQPCFIPFANQSTLVSRIFKFNTFLCLQRYELED